MMTPFDLALMIKYLKNKGYTQEELSHMSHERIISLYEEKTRDFILHAQEILETNKEDNVAYANEIIIPESLSIVSKQPFRFYDIIEDYIDSNTPREIANSFFAVLPHIKVKTLEKMVRIKIRQLQETWMLQLNNNLSVLPREERETLMEYFSRHKENLRTLRSMYEKSCDKDYIESLRLIATMKLSIIKDYMPDELESNYKVFYDHSPEKLAIIQEILKLSGAYSKGALLGFSIKDLNELLEELQKREEQKQIEKEQKNRYMEAFKHALHDPNDQVFVHVCLDAVSELSRQSFQEIAMVLAKQFKTFRQRFEDVAKEYGDMQSLQIAF